MIRVTIREAQAQFKALLDRALADEAVLITRDGVAVVQLVPDEGRNEERDIRMVPINRPAGLFADYSSPAK